MPGKPFEAGWKPGHGFDEERGCHYPQSRGTVAEALDAYRWDKLVCENNLGKLVFRADRDVTNNYGRMAITLYPGELSAFDHKGIDAIAKAMAEHPWH